MRIQEGHFLKIALNLDLTLSDDGECPTFFDSLRNYWFRCFLCRVMVIFRQQKNFGPNVIYFVLGTLVIVARLTYQLTKTLLIVPRLTYSWPKHCLLLRDWHFEALKAALGDLSGSPGFLRIPPGFHWGVRAMDWPLPGRVWEVSGRGPLSVTESFILP